MDLIERQLGQRSPALQAIHEDCEDDDIQPEDVTGVLLSAAGFVCLLAILAAICAAALASWALRHL